MVHLNFPCNLFPSVMPKYEKAGQGEVQKIHMNLKSLLANQGLPL